MFELFEFSWFGDEAGEFVESQLEFGGVDSIEGVFVKSDFSGVGATRGEGEVERVKKKLEDEGEREGDGEGETSGDLKKDDGGFEGLSDVETIDGDGVKGSETGDNEEGKCDVVGERVSLSSSLLVLGEAVFDAWRSDLLYALTPCRPMCLSQASNF